MFRRECTSTGEGSSGSYLAESLPGDSANRILEFSLREDGRLKMYVKMCAATKNCVRSPEGSTYYFDKIANPLIGN